jgi:hypothetical protein
VTPDEAWVVLDLGQRRAIGRVRWLVVADGLAGRLVVEVSPDGTRWQPATKGNQDAAKGDQDATADWQELVLPPAVEARYVRLRFTNPTEAPHLGGLAEVEVLPAVTSAANDDGSPPDQPRAAAGSGTATSGSPKGGKDQHGKHKGKAQKQGKHKPGKDQHGKHNGKAPHKGKRGRGG